MGTLELQIINRDDPDEGHVALCQIGEKRSVVILPGRTYTAFVPEGEDLILRKGWKKNDPALIPKG